MLTTLTGIQPSGGLHLGNYFGAVEPCLRVQANLDRKLLVFLANYHALTTVHDGEVLHRHTQELALDLMALGVDPSKTLLFRQSDVPEVTELALLLSMVTGMGELQRAHSYKDKVSKGITPNVGLFFYPVLMAADILIYDTNKVPVGKDQHQHVQMAQSMGRHFNETFGEVFRIPEASISEIPKVPGIDGQKMSKSYKNTISPFLEGDELRARVGQVVTSSTPFGEPLPTEGCPLFALLELVLDDVTEIREFFKLGRRGSKPFGYGHAKQILVEAIESRFQEERERRKTLTPDQVEHLLCANGAKARELARGKLDQARQACGIRKVFRDSPVYFP